MSKTKRYQLLKSFSLMSHFDVDGTLVTVTFGHGTRAPYHVKGRFTTANEGLQKAIEASASFGKEFYLEHTTEIISDEKVPAKGRVLIGDDDEANEIQNFLTERGVHFNKNTGLMKLRAKKAEFLKEEAEVAEATRTDEATVEEQAIIDLARIDVLKSTEAELTEEATAELDALLEKYLEAATEVEEVPEEVPEEVVEEVPEEVPEEDVITDYPEILTVVAARQLLLDTFEDLRPAVLKNKAEVLLIAKSKNVSFSKLK